MDDQGEVIDAVLRHCPGAVHLETHLSHVFVAADDVFKLKKPVSTSFVDYATTAKRKAACEKEVAINRRYVDGLYLGVVPVTAEGGAFRVGGSGRAVDHLVHMKPFEREAQLDRRIEAGDVPVDQMLALTDLVFRQHGEAPAVHGSPWDERFGRTFGELRDNLHSVPGLDRPAIGRWAEACGAALSEHGPRLRAIGEANGLRDCHGDLHTRNVCWWQGGFRPFDAVEFNDDLRRIDPLYDIAFLVMDLWHRGAHGHANRVLGRYLALADRYGDRGLAGLYMSVRAAVRALAEGMGGDRDAAGAYLATAGAMAARPRSSRDILMGGRSGSGKSTVAAALAPRLGPPPGALVVRSDVIRKRIFGLMPEDRLPASGYDKKVTGEVYRSIERLLRLPGRDYPVIADATFLGRGAEGDLPAIRVWLTAPDSVLRERLAGRGRDASDADFEVARRQDAHPPGAGWHEVDASGTVEETVETVLDLYAKAR